ncbi:MAG: hypothetical protein COT74_08215 [Bdellovibrionales bacterium CG10_big_fil_rev_8_21_14_0_10_45_34]|nr:MAG: hypothetical protein COT74_08215 [Bdellovibrionales bacterium CG10_big_fil_rev_8_21_14_0_10_45_34]
MPAFSRSSNQCELNKGQGFVCLAHSLKYPVVERKLGDNEVSLIKIHGLIRNQHLEKGFK